MLASVSHKGLLILSALRAVERFDTSAQGALLSLFDDRILPNILISIHLQCNSGAATICTGILMDMFQHFFPHYHISYLSPVNFSTK